MATTLLLEGDDLEALLARARAEGGPSARIVRAEKIRHGGFLGFFAKERFEVAIDVPDAADAADTAPAPGSAPDTHAAPPPPPSAGQAPPAPAPTPAHAAEGPAMEHATDHAPGALDRFTRRVVAAADDPAVAAREGLLGLADRADAEELAAARASHAPGGASPYTAGASPDPAAPFAAPYGGYAPDALDLALRRLLEAEPGLAGDAGAVPSAGPGMVAGVDAAGSPVRPSTTRPEFTALLDQLLAPTRPEATAVSGVPAPREPRPAAPVPAPAAVPPAYREVSLPPAHPPVQPPAHESARWAAEADVHTSAHGSEHASEQPPASPAPVEALQPTQPPAGGPAAPAAPPVVARHVLGRTTRPGGVAPNRDRREDPQLAADRRALRALGVPVAWTRQLRPGDRFTAVLRMLDNMPDVDIDPATRVVAVVGPAASVLLEAHRTALDLPVESSEGLVPRPVVVVPAAAGAERAAALAEARLLGEVVVAIEADAGQTAQAVEALQAVGAGAVLAIVAADAGLERAQAVLDALGQVDALAVEGTAASGEPAGVLQLGLPVARLDGIPVDRYTWTAVLLAQLGPVR